MKETALSPKTSYNALTVATTDGGSTKQNLGPAGTVRIVSSVDCFINFKAGSAPTASVTTGMYLPAFAPEYFTLSGFYGDGDVYVAGIGAAAGLLYVTVMN